MILMMGVQEKSKQFKRNLDRKKIIGQYLEVWLTSVNKIVMSEKKHLPFAVTQEV